MHTPTSRVFGIISIFNAALIGLIFLIVDQPWLATAPVLLACVGTIALLYRQKLTAQVAKPLVLSVLWGAGSATVVARITKEIELPGPAVVGNWFDVSVLVVAAFVAYFVIPKEPVEGAQARFDSVNSNLFDIYSVGEDEQSHFMSTYRNFIHREMLLKLTAELDTGVQSVAITGAQGAGKTTMLKLAWVAGRNKPENPFEEILLKEFQADGTAYQPGNSNESDWIVLSPTYFSDFNQYLETLFKQISLNLSVWSYLKSELLSIATLYKKTDYGHHLYALAAAQRKDCRQVRVVLDDLDRLRASEILEIVTIARAFTESRNVKFILLYDQAKLLEILRSEYSYIDANYLQKFIGVDLYSTIELSGYHEDWERFVNELSTQTGLDPEFAMLLAVDHQLSIDLTSLGLTDPLYDKTQSEIGVRLNEGIKDSDGKPTPLVSAFLDHPAFKRNGPVYADNFLRAPLLYLYHFEGEVSWDLLYYDFQGSPHPSIPYAELPPEIEEVLATETSTDPFYCATINCNLLPTWRTTKEALDLETLRNRIGTTNFNSIPLHLLHESDAPRP